MNKKPALIAALLTTIVVALAMVMIGVSAYTNPDSVPISTSSSAALDSNNIALASGSTAAADQVAQLQSLVAQYQSREQQYQTQLNQANTQIQQYQNLLTQLQARGVISIDRNGQVSIPRRGN